MKSSHVLLSIFCLYGTLCLAQSDNQEKLSIYAQIAMERIGYMEPMVVQVSIPENFVYNTNIGLRVMMREKGSKDWTKLITSRLKYQNLVSSSYDAEFYGRPIVETLFINARYFIQLTREDRMYYWWFQEDKSYEFQVWFFGRSEKLLGTSNVCEFTIPHPRKQDKKFVKYLQAHQHPAFVFNYGTFPDYLKEAIHLVDRYPKANLAIWAKLYILDYLFWDRDYTEEKNQLARQTINSINLEKYSFLKEKLEVVESLLMKKAERLSN